MRQMIAIVSLLLSFNLFSQELIHTFGNTKCTVTKNKAVKEYSYKDFKFSEVKEVKVDDLEKYIVQAYENSANTPANQFANVEAKFQDKSFNLDIKDSEAAIFLIHFATTVCK